MVVSMVLNSDLVTMPLRRNRKSSARVADADSGVGRLFPSDPVSYNAGQLRGIGVMGEQLEIAGAALRKFHREGMALLAVSEAGPDEVKRGEASLKRKRSE